MKRKLIACLLSVTMLCSLFPTFALATSADEEPTGTLSVICPVCEAENCTEHTPCATCGEYNCNGEHSVMPASDPETCETCGQADCDGQHTNWCPICLKDDCGIDHNAPQPCPTCGAENCESDHTNWCETCKKDDCGNPDHAVMPADEGVGDEGAMTPNGAEGDPDQELSFYDQLLAATRLKDLTNLLENTANNAEIAALTYEQLTAVEAVVETLYNATDKGEAETNKYTWLKGTLNNLKAQVANTFEELLETCTCSANKSRYVVHDSSCPAYIPLPGAKVTALDITKIEASDALDGEELPVTFAMQFETLDSYEEKQLKYYGPWRADFVITTNMPVTGNDAYLVGAYDLYQNGKWVKMSFDKDMTLPANEELRLISGTGLTDWVSLFTFENVNSFLKTFKCGIHISDTYMSQNPGFSVKVELRLYPVDAENNCDYSEFYNLTTINYQSTNATITYTAGDHGSVNNITETVGTLIHPSGSTPTANNGYHFEGWYTDENYTNRVPDSWVDAETGKLIPGTNSNGTYSTATYYAKFDPDTVDLKFELSGGKNTSTYLFTLTGEGVSLKLAVKGGESITIQDLPAGEYTITPDNNWNWRETVSVTGSGNLTQDATAAVTVTSNGKKQWFNGYAYDKN